MGLREEWLFTILQRKTRFSCHVDTQWRPCIRTADQDPATYGCKHKKSADLTALWTSMWLANQVPSVAVREAADIVRQVRQIMQEDVTCAKYGMPYAIIRKINRSVWQRDCPSCTTGRWCVCFCVRACLRVRANLARSVSKYMWILFCRYTSVNASVNFCMCRLETCTAVDIVSAWLTVTVLPFQSISLDWALNIVIVERALRDTLPT